MPLPEVVTAVEKQVQEYRAALADDFNTPEALAVLHAMLNLLEKQFLTNTISRASIRYILDRLRTASETLGVDLFSLMQEVFIAPEVTQLAEQRQAARENKQWQEADRLRKEILARGYIVEDTSEGPRLLPKASA